MKRIIYFLVWFFILDIGGNAQQINSFKTSDGETLYFSSTGKGQKVIILQGGPGYSVAGCQSWADSLSDKHECILFHQRGTGLSSDVKYDSTTINLKRAVNDLDDLRKFLGQEKLTLCGISWGGMLSQAYASKFPEKTEKIVLVSTVGPDMSLFRVIFNDYIPMRRYPDEKDSLKYWNSQPDNELSIFKRGLFFAVPYFFNHNTALKKMPELMKISPFNRQMSSLMWKDIYKNYDLNASLVNYKNPCIIIRPRQDIVPFEAISQIKELLPQSKIYTIERCGHFPDLEQPEKFFKILKEVL